MNYHFAVHPEETGFWAECVELEGCRTQAETGDELKESCREALNLYLEESLDSSLVFPLPEQRLDADRSLLSVRAAPEIALAVLLRNYRREKRLTQKQVSDLLGLKNLYGYQRLEKRSNPTLRVMDSLLKAFPDLDIHRVLQ